MNGYDLPSFQDMMEYAMSHSEPIKKKSLTSEEYKEIRDRVLSVRNPSDEDYKKLDYDDRDAWVETYMPGFGL